MAETMRTRAAAALPLIAFGVITGVSFLAQPAKFLTHAATAWALLGVFAVALGIQQFGLMPPLEARLMQLKQGLQPEPSALHFVYVALELVKLASLLSLAWLQPAERLLRPTSLGASS
jgi:hypothetical protein